MKSHFVPSRYLNSLSRYKEIHNEMNGSAIYIFLELILTRRYLCLILTSDTRPVKRARSPINDKDKNSEGVKITLFFTRRYLRNRKSYRDESKSVLKSKIPLFQRSFTRQPELTIFKIITVQNFFNFNRIYSNLSKQGRHVSFKRNITYKRYITNDMSSILNGLENPSI